jgi:tetratricopeptide (TPR) repeat protein
MINFVHPAMLWLLVLVGPTIHYYLKNHRDRTIPTLILRLIAFILLVLALARPIVSGRDSMKTVVVVADVSQSISDTNLSVMQSAFRKIERELSANEKLKLVIFDQTARVMDVHHGIKRTNNTSSGTALADALELAGGLIEHDGRGRIILFTDGLETSGDAGSVAYHLANRGISIEIVPEQSFPFNEVILKSAAMPAFGRIRETVNLYVQIESSIETSATMFIKNSGHETAIPIKLKVGLNDLDHSITLGHEGNQNYELWIESEKDTLRENNTWTVSIQVGSPLQVLVLDDQPESSAAKTLQTILDKSAEVTLIKPTDLTLEMIRNVNVLVLADVPSDSIPMVIQKRMAEAVIDGMGIFVTGGRRSYGPGGYEISPVSKVLPVEYSQNLQRRDPSATLVIIIDTSGSMGGSRVNLAKEVARLAIARLKPHDKVGIVEFYGSKRWASPIGPASNAIDIQRALNRLSAGGGTVILPAIEEAYYALQNVHTRTKHVLVLTDGGVERGAFEALIRKMADKGITLSTVMVGPGTDTEFLASLANWGHGRFYICSDRTSLPEIIVKQPESILLSPFVEKTSSLISAGNNSVTEGFDFMTAPKLHGYNETQLRPTADLVIQSDQGHPILATWQYGLGKVAAFTTQINGEWSNELLQWTSYNKLISNTIRSLNGTDKAHSLRISPISRSGGVEVAVDYLSTDTKYSFAPIVLSIKDSKGPTHTQILDPIGPNRWNAVIRELKPGLYRLDAQTEDGNIKAQSALTVQPIREITSLTPNKILIGEISRMQEKARKRANELSKVNISRPYEVWPGLVLAAMGFILLNVLVRRWPVSIKGNLIVILMFMILAGESVVSAETTQEAEAFISVNEYLDDGELESAYKILTNLTRKNPADVNVWSKLAQVEELLGNDDAAIVAIDQALANNPTEDQIFALTIRKVQLLYDRKEQSSAQQTLKKLTEQQSSSQSKYFLGYLAAMNDDYEIALTLLPSGDSFSQNLFRGLFFLRLDRLDEAQDEFEQAYRKAVLARDRKFALERVIAASRRGHKLNELIERWGAEPNIAPDRLMALVAVFRETGQAKQALDLIQSFAKNQKLHEFIQSADFQRELISVALEAEDPPQAEKAYRSLLEIEPGQVDWRIGLARLMLIDGNRTEGIEIFRNAITEYDDVSRLMALAQGARDLGLDDVAIKAANKAGRKGKNANIRAVIFRADLARLRGRTQEAVKIIKGLNATSQDDTGTLLTLAETFERYGDKAQALLLYKRLYQIKKTEDTLMKVSWLLEENDQLDEAFVLWKQMWQTTPVIARQQQSQIRLLDLAGRLEKLDDLSAELKKRIYAGPIDDRALSLLMEIYMRTNDQTSAVKILEYVGKRNSNKADTLNRLLKVYIGFEQYDHAEGVLKKLVKLDSKNTTEYQQQMVMIALERGDSARAKTYLAELQAGSKINETVDELSAGVLAMLGLGEEAAQSYRRVLDRHPDRIEAYLLWGNAMKSAGKSSQAIAKFQLLAEEAQADDLFVVAIDGLLNLNASPEVLRSAYRRIINRIAASPKKMFLYQLASDVLEAQNRNKEINSLLELSLVGAGERRGAILRELMENAKLDGQTLPMIEYGQSLLALGDEVPPKVFLDLGQAMINEGQLTLSQRVFERANVDENRSTFVLQVAKLYDEANAPAIANRMIRQLLIAEPDNVQLLIQSGSMEEQLGRLNRAYDQYYHAAYLLLSRLPGNIHLDVVKKIPGTSQEVSSRISIGTQGSNVDEFTQYFQPAESGLLSAARTESLQKRLLNQLSKYFKEEIDRLKTAHELRDTIEQNPRLNRIASFLRQSTFSLHQPQIADQADMQLLSLYPDDQALSVMLIKTRIEWGLYKRAITFAGKVSESTEIPEVEVSKLLNDQALLTKTISEKKVDAALAARMVLTLILNARDDEAKQFLHSIKPMIDSDINKIASEMVATSIVMDDDYALELWRKYWFAGIATIRNGTLLAGELEKYIEIVWNYLSPQEQSDLFNAISQITRALPDKERLSVDLLRLRLSEGMKIAFNEGDIVSIVKRAAENPAMSSDLLATLLEKVPSANRPVILRTMVSVRKPSAVRKFLMELTSQLRVPVDATLANTFEELFKSAPPIKAEPSQAYWILNRSGWNHNSHQREVPRRIGEILLNESPNDTTVLITVARSRENAGLHDEAISLIQEAMENLLGAKLMEYQDDQMVNDLVEIMNHQQQIQALEDLTERLDIEGKSPARLFIRGRLLEALDRTDQAVADYRSAFEMAPNNPMLSRKVIMKLRENGQEVELSRVLAAYLTRTSIMESFQWRSLTDIYRNIFNPLAALQTVKKDETPLSLIDTMQILNSMGRKDQVKIALRRYLIRNRNEGKFYSPYWPESSSMGGLSEFLTKKNKKTQPPERLFVALADLPGSEEEYFSMLLAARPERSDITSLIDGILKATSYNQTRKQLIKSFVELDNRDALNIKDRRLLLALVQDNPEEVPEEILKIVEASAFQFGLFDTSTLDIIAKIKLTKKQSSQALAIIKLQMIFDIQTGHFFRGDNPRENIDQIVALLPKDQQPHVQMKLLKIINPNPLNLWSNVSIARQIESSSLGNNREKKLHEIRILKDQIDKLPISDPQVLIALAQAEAGIDEYDLFKETIKKIFTDKKDSDRSDDYDYRECLPPAGEMKDPSRYIQAIVNDIETRHAAGQINRSDATHAFALIGFWCSENNLNDQARGLMIKAENLAGPLGEHWLWIADLARLINENNKALDIESSLLKQEMLPVVRVPGLLDAIEATHGQEIADQLALRVTEYSDHPLVLQRAIHYAQLKKNNVVFKKLSQRLENVTQAVPEN